MEVTELTLDLRCCGFNILTRVSVLHQGAVFPALFWLVFVFCVYFLPVLLIQRLHIAVFLLMK